MHIHGAPVIGCKLLTVHSHVTVRPARLSISVYILLLLYDQFTRYYWTLLSLTLTYGAAWAHWRGLTLVLLT